MSDTTIKKVSSEASPKGEMGQVHLASGKRVSMRLWRDEEPQTKEAARRDYETVGYVISGRAELHDRGADDQARARRLLAGPCGRRAQLLYCGELYGDRGDGAARPSPWP